MAKKILLLNPPSQGKYFIRDYYCSQVSKGRYCWPPLDLLILSGILKEHFEVHALDASVSGLNCEAALKAIGEIGPDAVISVVGAASWKSDMDFLKAVKDLRQPFMVVSGDYPLAKPEMIRDYDHLDAVLMDFTQSDIVKLLREERGSHLKNIYTREDQGAPVVCSAKTFYVPVPDHAAFPLRKYHLPHINHHPFATLMTDFGCPFACAFCPFERIEYKLRPVENIKDELHQLKSLGIRELWLRDQSFGSVRQHAIDFCELLATFGRFFFWSCEMRADAADEELLKKMKEAGCHTVMFGVESAKDEVLSRHAKKITRAQIEAAFVRARKVGLKILAHFIFGLSGEDLRSQEEILSFSLVLDPDYAVFNVAAPLWNTSFRDEVTKKGWLIAEDIDVDSSDTYPTWESPELCRRDVWRVREMAIRKFYLRPAFLWRQLRGVRSFYQARILVKEGWCFLKKRISFKTDMAFEGSAE